MIDPEKQHDDLRLLSVARRNRWDVPQDFRAEIINRLKAIVTEGDDEIALKAIAEVRHLEAQNQKDDHKVVDVNVQQYNDQLDSIAAELGIPPGLILDATAESGGADNGTQANGPTNQK